MLANLINFNIQVLLGIQTSHLCFQTCRKSKHQKEILHLLEATSKGWSWCNDDVKGVSKNSEKNPPKKNKEEISKKNALIKENSSLIKVEFLN